MNIPAATVFVVDDALENRLALTRLLASKGYDVCAFESAEHFLKAQDAQTPGCLLIEAVLPGMNGLELQRALLGSELLRPIIFLAERGDI